MLTDERVTEVLGERQRVIEALGAAHSQARTTSDPALLALCERRIASLLGVAIADDASDHGEVDPELERVAIVFVEQWLIDVASITEVMVVDLRSALGGDDELMDFLHSLLVVEQRLRLAVTWNSLGLAR